MRHKANAILVSGLSAAMTLILAAPSPAQSQRQRDKNNMRNLGTALGAIAAHQAIQGKTTNALVLGAGAAYAGKKYEDARKAQSEEQSRRWGRRNDDWRFDDRRRDDRFDNRRWADEEFEDRRYDRDRRPVRFYQRDNGKKRGHFKQQKSKDCR